MWYGERGGGETMVVSVVWHCSSQTQNRFAVLERKRRCGYLVQVRIVQSAAGFRGDAHLAGGGWTTRMKDDECPHSGEIFFSPSNLF